LFPAIGSNYANASNGNVVVGPGIEILNAVDGVGTIDISDTNLFADFTSEDALAARRSTASASPTSSA
jgi:hypothetical protein